MQARKKAAWRGQGIPSFAGRLEEQMAWDKNVRGRDGGLGLGCVSRSLFGASAKERVAVLWKGAPCTLVLGGWMWAYLGARQWKVRQDAMAYFHQQRAVLGLRRDTIRHS